ncbi:MAG: radical SAM protein [Lachnospiraceae bacterium]|nr:radical SAM protein [Lachnospiraceae bacterium]
MSENSVKCLILGHNDVSLLLKKVIETAYRPLFQKVTGNALSVEGFFVESPEDADAANGIIALKDLKDAYDNGVRLFIIPEENYVGQSVVTSAFLLLGIPFDAVSIAQPVRKELLQPDRILSLLTPFYSAGYLPYLEYHVADHCNLNCKACEHYSGLVEGEVYPDFEALSRDLEKLHSFIPRIGQIRILGGEPLLNPDICAYIDLTRRLYPDTQLSVVTNGIRLFSIGEEFYDAVRRNQASIHVSLYPPLKDRAEDLKALLALKNVRHDLSDPVTSFTKKQILQPHDHPFEAFAFCFQSRCHNLYDGKLAACFLPFTTKYFNAYFKKELPEDGAIDLYDPALSTEAVKRHLLTPLARCAYCTDPVDIDWATMHEPSILEDWVIDAK